MKTCFVEYANIVGATSALSGVVAQFMRWVWEPSTSSPDGCFKISSMAKGAELRRFQRKRVDSRTLIGCFQCRPFMSFVKCISLHYEFVQTVDTTGSLSLNGDFSLTHNFRGRHGIIWLTLIHSPWCCFVCVLIAMCASIDCIAREECSKDFSVSSM